MPEPAPAPPPAPPLRTALPDPRPGAGKDAALVQAMFDRIAGRYDLANSVLSLGQDRHWRRVAARAAGAAPGRRIADVAAGTGALSGELAAAGAQVVAVDFSLPMVRTGAARHADERLWFVNGDGTRLPLADASVDAVTIAFGLRNVPDPAAGLAEFARVVRPGGRLVVLEFSTPTAAPWRHMYERYLVGALPRIARVVSDDPRAYRYLADSILAWPDQRRLAAVIATAGWTDVGWKNLAGGIVAVHRARRP